MQSKHPYTSSFITGLTLCDTHVLMWGTVWLQTWRVFMVIDKNIHEFMALYQTMADVFSC